MPIERYKDKLVPINKEKPTDFSSQMGDLDKLLTWAEIVDKFDVDLTEFSDKSVIEQPIYLNDMNLDESQVNEIVDLLNSVKDTYSFEVDTNENIVSPKTMKDHQVIFSALNQAGANSAPSETADIESEADDEDPSNVDYISGLFNQNIENKIFNLIDQQLSDKDFDVPIDDDEEFKWIFDALYKDYLEYRSKEKEMVGSEEADLETEMSDSGKDAFRKALQNIADGKDVESSLNTTVKVSVKDVLSLDPDVQEVIDLAKNKHKEYDAMNKLNDVIDSLETFLSKRK